MHPFIKYFDNLSQTGFSFETSLLPRLKQFLEACNSTDAVVIDFGCGTKPYAYLFEDFQGAYLGLDVYSGKTVDLVYDGKQIPLENESVDLVFSSSVFEHVEDIAYSLQEISRVLKPGGSLIAVVPFMGHVHGTPFDYHRPTRFGWESLLKKSFNDFGEITVEAVDSRLNCIINIITGQINMMIIDCIKWFRNLFASKKGQKNLFAGDASPESRETFAMEIMYLLLKLNPVNFLLGFLCWLLCTLSIARPLEGEITSGYLINVQKVS